MNFMQIKTVWDNWHLWLYKVATFSCGILFGYYFYNLWNSLLPLVWVVAIVTTVMVSYTWTRKMLHHKKSARL